MVAHSTFTLLFALLAPLAAFAELTSQPLGHAHNAALHRRQVQSPSLTGPSALTPFQDPFYSPTPGWQNKKPGDILKFRQIKTYGTGVASTWQLLYRSQSHNGTALHTVTTVWVPTGAFKDRFILAGRPDNSVSYTCAPSTRFTNGTVDDQRFFDKKWIVTSVDHEGPDAAFGAGRLQGRLMLDAGRALLNFQNVGLQRKSKIVITGYSGGAGAAGWAATLASTYSPDLNVVGAAFGGVPADLGAIVQYTDGGLFAGLPILGVFGIAEGYQNVFDRLKQIVLPQAQSDWNIAGMKCLSDAFQAFAGQKVLSSNYTTDGANLLKDPVLKPVLDTLVLGGNPSETPKFPMYVYNGVIDQIIPVTSVDAMVDRFCASSGNVLYRRVLLADHFAGVSDADVVPYVEGRFAGAPFASGCRRTSAIFPFQNTYSAGTNQKTVKSNSVPSIKSDTLFTSDDKSLAASTQANTKTKNNHILKLHGSARHAALKGIAKKFSYF